MSLKKTVFLLFALMLFSLEVFAQDENSFKDTIELPFFDDFSYLSDSPSDKLWKNSGTTISRYMAKNPPSIGVLVFDCLDSLNQFYKHAYYGSVCSGDTIETLPINLDYQQNKTIFLSFALQAGGNGDMPEKQDSLCLDFYAPKEDCWVNIKQYSFSSKTEFSSQIINISEEKFLQKGFKFRFRNYFSLGSSSQKDLVSNCDFWYVDYVRLDKNRYEGDTLFSDVALTKEPIVKYGDYTLVPWKHYLEATNQEKLSYQIFYRNNDSKPRLLDSINLYLNGEKYALGSYNMPSYMDFENDNSDLNYRFTSLSDTVANIDIEVKLVSDVTSKDFPDNNYVLSKKTFYDSYAYDDGTAEAAYGLYGEGSQDGLVAVRFVSLKPDKLKGVYMYFCPVFQNAQADYFNIKVFNSLNGKPFVEIYSKNNVSVPKENPEKFVFFPFDNLVQITDTFYIGWQKLSKEIIAVGFDKTISGLDNKFYNLDGVWKQSKENGQIMIRPAFGYLTTAIEDLSKGNLRDKLQIKVYPNPAKEYFVVESDLVFSRRINIYNVFGQKVKSVFAEDSKIKISAMDLKSGMYILEIEGIEQKKKILITR